VQGPGSSCSSTSRCSSSSHRCCLGASLTVCSTGSWVILCGVGYAVCALQV
jgi:hypothetical protein